jgi:NADH-quinone oxidoreductase subunit M
MHTRRIDAYGGLVHRMPLYAVVFMVFTMATIGLPGTSGFVGEVLVLVGAFKANTWVTFLAATGVVLGAAYSLWLYRRVVFGVMEKDELKSILDMNRREMTVFAPLIVATLWLGIYPAVVFQATAPAVKHLLQSIAK